MKITKYLCWDFLERGMNLKDKIILIGPVYPYKGGISHYTGLMYRALSKLYDVEMLSYKFQYPKLLYKKEQRDYSNDTFKIENTNYTIHTANPFNWVKTAQYISKKQPKLVVIQWWHPYFAPCYWLLCKLLKNTRILFVCHNVFPHERFPMDRFLARMTLKQGDCYIVQSKMDADDLQTIIDNPVFKQTVHPTYNAFKIEDISKEEGRKRLNISEDRKVLLFFGFIREYKGLKYLIQAMPEIIKKLEDCELLVVGDFANEEEKAEYEALIQKCRVQNTIKVYGGYIPDKEVEKFFAASDLVVLPYISATQSGIVQIAYGFEKPVVVTNVGGLPDVVEDGKTGYVVEAENPNEIARVIVAYFNENKENEFVANVKSEAYRFSWDRIVEVVEEL